MKHGAPLLDQDLVEKIAARAYELYEARGRQDGLDVQDWLQAEREILLNASRDTLEDSSIETVEDSPIDSRRKYRVAGQSDIPT
jgi:hypothetical protein